MSIHRRLFLSAATVALCALLSGCGHDSADDPTVLRVGFFPNITHAPALAGYHETLTKGTAGWFESRTGVRIEWYPFNAGPGAIEALFTGAIDITYVGPSPVINGFTRTKGMDIRVLSGAARGGAALLVRRDALMRSPADFRGKRIATPQLGGTQDVTARAWLVAAGLSVTQRGGDAFVLPTANPDQLDLFKRGDLDAAWTVEPWVSRLEMEAGAEILVEQREVLTTLLAGSVKSLAKKTALLKQFTAAHEELIAKVAADPAWAKASVSAALLKTTGKALPPAVLESAWPRLTFTPAISIADFTGIQRDARSAGLLPGEIDLSGLFAK